MKFGGCMKTVIKACMILLSLGATSFALAADITPFSATYSLSADGKTGSATRTLSQSGNTFNYKVSAKIAGIATANQSASFNLSAGNISPVSATTTYKALGVGRTHTIKYNGNKIVSTYKGKTTELTKKGAAYDDLSLEMQIRQELLNNKFSGSYYVVKKTNIEYTQFKKAGNVKITTPVGSYDTVRIDRVHDDNSRATSFYLAPSLGYLPVKVTQTTDGKTITMTLSKFG